MPSSVWRNVCLPIMKIQNNGSPGSAPLETTRAQPAPNDLGSSAAAGRSISGHDGDSVEISSMSARVSDANAVEGQQRANRVTELAALHSRGGYQVSAANLSNVLITQAVETAPAGKV
jgi:anti-sigma28 factor (negative regulator of flagellin synthesis)